MALDPKSSEHPTDGDKRASGDIEVSHTTDEFEEYTSAPRLDEHGKPLHKAKGLRASGHQFPPPGGPQPPLTKANLAKGIGVPDIHKAAPAAKAEWPLPPLPGKPGHKEPRKGSEPEKAEPAHPPAVKVHEDPLFEEYQRPDLKEHPRTGTGIRFDPPPAPSAKELLEKWEPPVPEVHTPKRFSVMEPKRPKAEERTQQEDAAHLDAVSDTMLAPNATMSTPATGPVKTVVHHEDDDLFAPSPEVPPAPPSPSPLPAQAPPVTPMPRPAAWGPSKSMMTPPAHGVAVHASPPAAETHGEAAAPPPHAPHAPDAPSVKPGGTVPRIGLVQCDFNHAITTAMAASALAEAHRLGAPVVQHLHVPGVFDSPLAVKTLLERRDVDAVVVVGAVLQGETGHDELISHAAAQTLLAIACNTGKPVGLGITGPRMSRPQAESRVHSGAFAVASVVAQHRMLVGLAA